MSGEHAHDGGLVLITTHPSFSCNLPLSREPSYTLHLCRGSGLDDPQRPFRLYDAASPNQRAPGHDAGFFQLKITSRFLSLLQSTKVIPVTILHATYLMLVIG